MNASAPIRLVAENLAPEARALAPHEGRHHAVEVDEAALRTWLGNFSALSAFEAEEAGARLHLSTDAQRLVVRWIGGRFGTEKADTFVTASVEEIVTELLSRPDSAPLATETSAGPAESDPVHTPRPRSRGRGQAVLLAALLGIFATASWWTLRPEIPEGVLWIEDPAERDAILVRTAGRYASDNERLSLDAQAVLTATNEEGVPTLRTTVRTGRRGSAAVLVTEAGVVIEIAATGNLRIEAVDYLRAAPGS